MNNEFEKGISLYLSLIIMTIFLAIVLGMSPILISQIKMVKGMGDSVKALYAADTGIEKVLNDGASPLDHYGPTSLDNDSSYESWVTQPSGGTMPGIPESADCAADYYCVKSIGTYQEINRAIEIVR